MTKLFGYDLIELRNGIGVTDKRKIQEENPITTLQKLELRRSEIREKLSELSSLESLTPENKTEVESLTKEFQDSEVRYRAALVAEQDKAETRELGSGGEAAEIRSLRGRAPLGDYVLAAIEKRSLDTPHTELNDALGLKPTGQNGGVVIPFSVLASAETRDKAEKRTFTAASGTGSYDGPTVQRQILQELFGPGILDTLGVRLDSVPVGASEWPLLTGKVAPALAKEKTAATAASVATFTVATLKPKRLTAEIEFTHELAASVVGLEAAFRQNLMDSMRSQMSNIILIGKAVDGSNPHRIEGFVTKLTGTDLSTAEAAASDYGKLHSLAVDGIHASNEKEVMSVIGEETYQHAAGAYLANTVTSGSELLERRSGGCMASSYIPPIASKKQAAILHAAGPNGGPMRGDSVGGIWEGAGLEIVRDIYSNRSVGVTLTGIILWDAAVALRTAAYKQIDIQVEK